MDSDTVDIIIHIIWGFSLLVAWGYSIGMKRIKFKK
jgi:hypothetical protein